MITAPTRVHPIIQKTIAPILKLYQFDYAIWWYVAPTIINTFLEQYDMSGKTVIPFATSGGSGMGNTNAELAPSCPGAVLKEGKRFSGNVGEKEIKKWVENLGV